MSEYAHMFVPSKVVERKDSMPIMDATPLFDRLKGEVENGFVTITTPKGAHYLFIIGGKPYKAATIGRESSKTITVKRFFYEFLVSAPVDIEVHSTDVKVVYGMLLCVSGHQVESKQNNMHDRVGAMREIESKGLDAIMAIELRGRWAFAFFIEGKAVYFSNLAKISNGGQSSDFIIGKIKSLTELAERGEVNISVFLMRKIQPSPDTEDIPETGLFKFYTSDLAMERTIMPDALKEYDTSPKSAHEVVLEGYLISPSGKRVVLRSLTSIGRDESSDVIISSMLAGKPHAVIIKEKDGFRIEKRGGIAPLKVNGSKVKEAVLESGDKIDVAGKLVIFNTGKKDY